MAKEKNTNNAKKPEQSKAKESKERKAKGLVETLKTFPPIEIIKSAYYRSLAKRQESEARAKRNSIDTNVIDQRIEQGRANAQELIDVHNILSENNENVKEELRHNIEDEGNQALQDKKDIIKAEQKSINPQYKEDAFALQVKLVKAKSNAERKSVIAEIAQLNQDYQQRQADLDSEVDYFSKDGIKGQKSKEKVEFKINANDKAVKSATDASKDLEAKRRLKNIQNIRKSKEESNAENNDPNQEGKPEPKEQKESRLKNLFKKLQIAGASLNTNKNSKSEEASTAEPKKKLSPSEKVAKAQEDARKKELNKYARNKKIKRFVKEQTGIGMTPEEKIKSVQENDKKVKERNEKWAKSGKETTKKAWESLKSMPGGIQKSLQKGYDKMINNKYTDYLAARIQESNKNRKAAPDTPPLKAWLDKKAKPFMKDVLYNVQNPDQRADRTEYKKRLGEALMITNLWNKETVDIYNKILDTEQENYHLEEYVKQLSKDLYLYKSDWTEEADPAVIAELEAKIDNYSQTISERNELIKNLETKFVIALEDNVIEEESVSDETISDYYNENTKYSQTQMVTKESERREFELLIQIGQLEAQIDNNKTSAKDKKPLEFKKSKLKQEILEARKLRDQVLTSLENIEYFDYIV